LSARVDTAPMPRKPRKSEAAPRMAIGLRTREPRLGEF
jgi:hypothetical protein